MFRMDEDRARFIDAMTKLLAVIAVAVGGGWTLYTYFNGRSQEARTALVEARKPFEAKRLELYLDLSSTTAIIAMGQDKAAVAKAKEHLSNLYWGPAALFGDRQVQDAMTDFGRCLDLPQAPCSNDLPQLARRVTEACRLSLGATWDIYLPDNVITFERLEKLR
jgi:hypothetical protein